MLNGGECLELDLGESGVYGAPSFVGSLSNLIQPPSTGFQGLQPTNRPVRYRLQDRTGAWQQANGDGRQQNQISEAIGEEGMKADAEARGYQPLLIPQGDSPVQQDAGGIYWTPGTRSQVRQGFDAVYWDPGTGSIVIGEAKGGYNGMPPDMILKTGYGYRQGTVQWAKAAAFRILRSGKTNDPEVKVATKVLYALSHNLPVRVELFHTEQTAGAPGPTSHYVTDQSP